MDNTENKTPLDLSDAEPIEIAKEAAAALFRKKGIDICLFEVSDRTVIADYYVICSGRASTHVAALADEVDYKLGKVGVRSYRTEGRDGGEWLLVDFGAVIVHIFSREAREYYNLERLLDEEKKIDLEVFFEDVQNKIETGELEA